MAHDVGQERVDKPALLRGVDKVIGTLPGEEFGQAIEHGGGNVLLVIVAEEGNADAAIVKAPSMSPHHAHPTSASFIDVAVAIHQIVVTDVAPLSYDAVVVVDGPHEGRRVHAVIP